MATYEVVDIANPNDGAITVDIGELSIRDIKILDRALRNDFDKVGMIDPVSRPIRRRNIRSLHDRVLKGKHELEKRAGRHNGE